MRFLILAAAVLALPLLGMAQQTRTTASTGGSKLFTYPYTIDDLVIQLLRGPVKILALVIFLQVGLNVFQWPVWLENWLRKGFYLLLAASLTYMVLRLVDLGATYWRRYPGIKADKTFNDLLIPLISKSGKAFIIIMAVLVTLDNIGFNIRTLLAGVSISGLALGLAAQDTVGNLFGAARFNGAGGRAAGEQN